MSDTLTIPTAEPFFYSGGETGTLLIHGFTGTPKEMRWMGEYLAGKGYSVLGVRLFGHATRPEDMLRARLEDWLASVEDGLNLLKTSTKRQFVMGLSMGGILALIAGARYPLSGVVAMSTPFNLPADPRLPLLPILSLLQPRVGKGASDWHNPQAALDHVDYPYYPTRAILTLQKLIGVMHTSLPGVKAPVLLMQSHQDHGIPAESMESIFNLLGSADKQMLWLENSGHVITREPEREVVFSAAESFMRRILSGK
jgi:carboxylesterase